MKVLAAGLPGAEVRPLANSYHVATLDYDAPEIFAGTLAFVRQHSVTRHSVTRHSVAEHDTGNHDGAKRSEAEKRV